MKSWWNILSVTSAGAWKAGRYWTPNSAAISRAVLEPTSNNGSWMRPVIGPGWDLCRFAIISTCTQRRGQHDLSQRTGRSQGAAGRTVAQTPGAAWYSADAGSL